MLIIVFKKYSQIRLKRTVSAQQIFQSLVRNKQFKFSRGFEIKTNLVVELAEQDRIYNQP